MAYDSSADNVILVTGGHGFLGAQVVKRLSATISQRIIAPRRAEYDLTKEVDVRRLFQGFQPRIVVHIAGATGGIEFSRRHPADLLYQNLMMNTLVLEYSRRAKVAKFVGIGTVCSYPEDVEMPMKEEDLWQGYPEEINAPYGMAKKMLVVQSDAYRKQDNLNGISLLLANLYGPGDNFDPKSSHVIPALIRKCMEAIAKGEREIVLWGDGSATREFLYVRDAAEGIVLATQKYNDSDPVNLGSGTETSIKDLANLVAKITGFSGHFTWDTTMPKGQPRRRLDNSRAAKAFGFRASTSLEDGLRQTVNWYRIEHRVLQAASTP